MVFGPTKGTSLSEMVSHLIYFASKLVQQSWRFPPLPQKINSSQVNVGPEGHKIMHAQNKTGYLIWMEFCLLVGISSVITSANFGDHRLRGLGGHIFVPCLYILCCPYKHFTTTVVNVDAFLSQSLGLF